MLEIERGITMERKINDTYLKATKGEKTDHVPVWFMRQAGRSQPEIEKSNKNILYLKSLINQNYVPM